MSMRPDDHRRKWDRDEYERLAEERKKEEREQLEEADSKKRLKPVKRELLKQREYKVGVVYITDSNKYSTYHEMKKIVIKA